MNKERLLASAWLALHCLVQPARAFEPLEWLLLVEAGASAYTLAVPDKAGGAGTGVNYQPVLNGHGAWFGRMNVSNWPIADLKLTEPLREELQEKGLDHARRAEQIGLIAYTNQGGIPGDYYSPRDEFEPDVDGPRWEEKMDRTYNPIRGTNKMSLWTLPDAIADMEDLNRLQEADLERTILDFDEKAAARGMPRYDQRRAILQRVKEQEEIYADQVAELNRLREIVGEEPVFYTGARARTFVPEGDHFQRHPISVDDRALLLARNRFQDIWAANQRYEEEYRDLYDRADQEIRRDTGMGLEEYDASVEAGFQRFMGEKHEAWRRARAGHDAVRQVFHPEDERLGIMGPRGLERARMEAAWHQATFDSDLGIGEKVALLDRFDRAPGSSRGEGLVGMDWSGANPSPGSGGAGGGTPDPLGADPAAPVEGATR